MEATTAAGEILVLPFFGQGHLFPAMELCKNLSSSHHFNITLIIPSHLSSSVPSTFTTHSPLLHLTHISCTPPPEEQQPPRGSTGNPLQDQNRQMGEGIKSFLSTRSGAPPTCVVMDVMMSWTKEIFIDYNIPLVSFSTSGAASSAMGYAKWKAHVGDMKPGETRVLPGLPKDMSVTFSDLIRGRRGRGRGRPQRHNGPPGGPAERAGPPNGKRFGHPTRGGGPPQPGEKPRWLDEVDGSVALLINTCDNLERLFIDYLAEQIKLPVWGVGPLLPEQFWKSAGSILHDHELRSNRKSNYTEDEVIQWLETKPQDSVIYISFGSEVGPSIEEYNELAQALEESNWPFIWVIQPGSGKTSIPRSFLGHDTDTEEEEGYYPEGLDITVGDRGLIISGWAPQLLILSHPSTGGFLSHCGWNSTVEALGLGLPILTWPIRGDQFDNAKLVVNHLKVGHEIAVVAANEGQPAKYKKDDIAAGIERLMGDEEVHKQAKALSRDFESGFPVSSMSALGAFVEFISPKAT